MGEFKSAPAGSPASFQGLAEQIGENPVAFAILAVVLAAILAKLFDKLLK